MSKPTFDMAFSSALLDDASKTYKETGLTPRQLAEQRRELIEALEALRKFAHCKHHPSYSEEKSWDEVNLRVDAAIARVRGEEMKP